MWHTWYLHNRGSSLPKDGTVSPTSAGFCYRRNSLSVKLYFWGYFQLCCTGFQLQAGNRFLLLDCFIFPKKDEKRSALSQIKHFECIFIFRPLAPYILTIFCFPNFCHFLVFHFIVLLSPRYVKPNLTKHPCLVWVVDTVQWLCLSQTKFH